MGHAPQSFAKAASERIRSGLSPKTIKNSAALLAPTPNPARRVGDVWVANYYSARNPLRLSSLVILGVVARMFRCATRSSCWCT